MNRERKSDWITGRKALGAYLGVSPRTVSRLVRDGQIPFRRISKKLLIFRCSDVDRAIERVGDAYLEAQGQGVSNDSPS